MRLKTGFYATLAVFVFIYCVTLTFVALSTDIYCGKIVQPPRISVHNEREIGLLAPGKQVANTIVIKDFCLVPFTRLCRTNSADIHNSFEVGEHYCVSAYGWRVGLLSWKPNMVEIFEAEG